jgi:hypothetical protein
MRNPLFLRNTQYQPNLQNHHLFIRARLVHPFPLCFNTIGIAECRAGNDVCVVPGGLWQVDVGGGAENEDGFRVDQGGFGEAVVGGGEGGVEGAAHAEGFFLCYGTGEDAAAGALGGMDVSICLIEGLRLE